ncbi:MAG: hypothetical protein AAFX40_11480 [Cyanobacteria bacterium J06639_1]
MAFDLAIARYPHLLDDTTEHRHLHCRPHRILHLQIKRSVVSLERFVRKQLVGRILGRSPSDVMLARAVVIEDRCIVARITEANAKLAIVDISWRTSRISTTPACLLDENKLAQTLSLREIQPSNKLLTKGALLGENDTRSFR